MNIEKKLTPDENYKIKILKIDMNDLETKLNAKKNELSNFYNDLRLKYSSLKVGDDIYNFETGECVGVVTQIYPDFEELLCLYRYKKDSKVFDTTRYNSSKFGSKQDLIDHLEQKIKSLKNN